jgi:hypothetical protein
LWQPRRQVRVVAATTSLSPGPRIEIERFERFERFVTGWEFREYAYHR